jgi:hypothetical protein
MGLMSARRLVLVAVASLSSLAAGALLGAPAAFAEVCPNEAARSGASAALPECRAYEQVTPTDKSGIAQDMTFNSAHSNETVQVAVDGDRVAYFGQDVEGLGLTPEPFESFVMFTRTPSGWQTESVSPPGSGGTEYGDNDAKVIFTPNLNEVATPAADYNLLPRSTDQLMQVGPAGGPFTTMASIPILDKKGSEGTQETVYGATPDFSSIFFGSRANTLPDSPAGELEIEGVTDIQQWKGGMLSVVNVNSEGKPLSPCGAIFKAVSEDGSKIIFRTPGDGSREEPSCYESEKRLWMREGSRLVEISKPNPGVTPEPHKEVRFAGASLDGSRVFFTTEMTLTKEAEEEGYPSTSNKLYEYDTDTSTLTLISCPQDGNGVVRDVLPSADGSRVYILYEGGSLHAGESLYRYNTTTGESHYIITASFGTDLSEAGENDEDEEGAVGAYDVSWTEGKFFAFYSHYPLEAGPISGSDKSGGGSQVYRYDDETEETICVSCLPESAPFDKASEVGEAEWRNFATLGWDKNPPPYSDVSSNGNVFFESTVRYVPQAVNVDGGGLPEEEGNTDVYEWHNGVISLIGSPNDPFGEKLLGASPDGSNVFFLSHAELVPSDMDNAGDIYDARIDGGFPPVTEPAACEGDTCLVIPPALNDPTPGSASFSGPGNPAPVLITRSSGTKPKAKGCGKGRVLKKGKCVRKPKAKKAARRAVKRNRGGSK